MPPAADSPLTMGVSPWPLARELMASSTQESGMARKSLVSQSRMLQAAGETSRQARPAWMVWSVPEDGLAWPWTAD